MSDRLSLDCSYLFLGAQTDEVEREKEGDKLSDSQIGHLACQTEKKEEEHARRER